MVQSGRPQIRTQYGAENKSEHSRPHNIWCLFILHCINGNANAPQCYVTRTLPVLFMGIITQIYLLMF
jgi:hypothetical protein